MESSRIRNSIMIHGSELDEISQFLTPAKIPTAIIYRVLSLEEKLGLEVDTLVIVHRVKFLEDNASGNMQNCS